MAEMNLGTRRKEKSHVTKEDVKRGLEQLGLKRADVLGVLASWEVKREV